MNSYNSSLDDISNSLGECTKKYKLTKTVTTINDYGAYYYDFDISEITKNALTDGTSIISSINNSNMNGSAYIYGKTISDTEIRCFFNGSLSGESITFNIIK